MKVEHYSREPVLSNATGDSLRLLPDGRLSPPPPCWKKHVHVRWELQVGHATLCPFTSACLSLIGTGGVWVIWRFPAPYCRVRLLEQYCMPLLAAFLLPQLPWPVVTENVF